MNQHSIILGHLNKGHGLTKLGSIKLFGIINLSDCVLILRRKGNRIKTTMQESPNGRKFAVYSLDAS